jgi:RNA-binding protein
MEKQAIKELKRRALEIKPTVHVGKEGLGESIIEELKAQLKRSKLVKVRILTTAGMSAAEVAAAMEEATGAKLVDVRGNTAIFSDKRLFRSLCEAKYL